MVISFCVPSPVLAAGARNVQVRLEGSRAAVTFDIPGEDPVRVGITFSDERGRFKASPGSLSGDLGDNVAAGKGKSIYWNFLKDYPYGLPTKTIKAHVELTTAVNNTVPARVKGEKMPKIRIETSMGTIIAELDAEKSPITVENILTYVNEGYYDGTIFHRVIGGFMIQGGGFNSSMEMKETRAPIKNEAGNGLKNAKGTLAMARTSDVDSATAQFFINLVDNDFLDHKNETPAAYGYAVFGKVVEGMDVVENIGKVSTGNHMGFQDVPVEPVVIEKVTLVE
jgi:cyclophilin family peptidyl-prolyl cis-trans isomerase